MITLNEFKEAIGFINEYDNAVNEINDDLKYFTMDYDNPMTTVVDNMFKFIMKDFNEDGISIIYDYAYNLSDEFKSVEELYTAMQKYVK